MTLYRGLQSIGARQIELVTVNTIFSVVLCKLLSFLDLLSFDQHCRWHSILNNLFTNEEFELERTWSHPPEDMNMKSKWTTLNWERSISDILLEVTNLLQLIAHPHILVRATNERWELALVATSGSHWLSLVEPTLKVAPVGRNRSLIARTNVCGWALTFSFRKLIES